MNVKNVLWYALLYASVGFIVGGALGLYLEMADDRALRNLRNKVGSPLIETAADESAAVQERAMETAPQYSEDDE